MANDRPVFIVGCPRSGTTLLALMVHAHPRLAMPPETRFLLRAWRRRGGYPDLSWPQHRWALAEQVTGDRTIADLGLSPDRARSLVMAAPPTLGSALGVIFADYARRQGKARWGDKRPAYFAEVDVLLTLFPDAQIIHVLRDGRAVVASLKRMPWWDGSSVGAMARWSFAQWCLTRDRRRLPPDTFHVVRYEDLLGDTETAVRGLCVFLGEDFDPAMLHPERVRDVVPAYKTWHRRLNNPVDSVAIDSWRDQLDPWELGVMEAVAGRSLRRHGYALTGDGARPSPRQLAAYFGTSRRMRRRAKARWRAEEDWVAEARHPIAAVLTSSQRRLANAPEEAE